ncbi:hypothetical protein NHX12_023750 [Muraenolepis orangiensis]|uniref:HAT C-terminal dimerisation domain-containing protein n=1 Tax=Muraenolepis orangiensis TaxID=630683 RepID=A0A9Q0ENP8_9TELE|nr:hypothetical protein NHX12_023750 [Muraenolepis orangiensis]
MDRFFVLKCPRVDTLSKPPESEKDSAHNRPREAEAEGVTVTDQEEDQEKPWEDGDSFYPVIDRLLMEMKRRFSTETNEVLRGVSALSPKHTSFLDKKMILPMARHYRISEENLSAELYQVRRLLQRKEEQGHTITSTKEFLSLMRPYRDAFIDLYKLICISLTLPVTSVSCERSFSCLRRLKNYLRNTSGDSRTSNLALLAINTPLLNPHLSVYQPLLNPHLSVYQPLLNPHLSVYQPLLNPHLSVYQPLLNPHLSVYQPLLNPHLSVYSPY